MKEILYERAIYDRDLGMMVSQFVYLNQDGKGRAYERYEDGIISDEVEVKTTGDELLDLGYFLNLVSDA